MGLAYTTNYNWEFSLADEQLSSSNTTLQVIVNNIDTEVYRGKYRLGEFSLNELESEGLFFEIGIGADGDNRDNVLEIDATKLVKVPYTFEVEGNSTLGSTVTLNTAYITNTLNVAEAGNFAKTLDVTGVLTVEADIEGTITGGTF